MNMTDPIADMLTRIRNGLMSQHEIVSMPSSRIKVKIAAILKEEGYIRNFRMQEQVPQNLLRVHLKYDREGAPAITGLSRVSKPGRRVYANRHEIPLVLGGLGIHILTTSRGVMTGHRSRAEGVGGELLCKVW